MQVVFEVLSAFAASVAIVNAENLQFGPVLARDARLLLGGLNHVQNDRDSVLVSFAHRAHICICGKGFHGTERFRTYFASLEKWQSRLRLIFMKQFGHRGFYTVRSHLRLSANFFTHALRLLWQRRSFHYDAESGPLAQVFKYTCR